MTSKHIENVARDTSLLFWECSALRKLYLAPDWSIDWAKNAREIEVKLEEATNRNRQIMVVASVKDYHSVMQAILAKVPYGRPAGILLVGQQDMNVFNHLDSPHIIVDVVNEKEFRRNSDFYLIKSFRHLKAAFERSISKVDQRTLQKLNQIFIELSAERNLERLLTNIMLKAIEVGRATAGILYLVHEADGDMVYRIRVTHNAGAEQTELETISTRVVENSLCGYVALTGKPINLSNTESVKALTLPQASRAVDYWQEGKEYALLTLPLKNSRNEIAAVLQLVREKVESSITFGEEEEAVLTSFSTQAAICIENVDLYADIERLFNGFVKASIAAIESRDPSTGGHSERVARMTVGLARATTECETGIYRSVRFREEEIKELEYAALLHDFGKIGIREEILVKAKKLFPYQLDAIRDRIRICTAAARISVLEEKSSEKEYLDRLHQVQNYWELILAANEPNIVRKDNLEALKRIRHEKIFLPDGSLVNLLTEEEYEALSVQKGSLTESERLEVESHVRHTYQFLKMIPWTKDFRRLTEIAYCHHEKLDGTGYPRGLSAHEIPLQSKIMTIADIYDALTAADRWYKEAVPPERALDIIQEDVNQGKVDPVLFDLFVAKKIYLLTSSNSDENAA